MAGLIGKVLWDVNTSIINTVSPYFENFKINSVLKILKWYSRTQLLMAKLFDILVSTILSLPDDVFENNLSGKIHVLKARNESLDITNKFRIFLKLYSESEGSSFSGFNMNKYKRILNSSLLYCCYVLDDKNPETFLDHAKTFLIQEQSGKFIENGKVLPFSQKEFEEEQIDEFDEKN